MKICGFTIIRNAIKYDYPVIESINSILPICDEFVVSVGNSDDETLTLIQGINSPKIKIIETTWDDNLRKGGQVLANETNKALSAISDDVDWCFYIQSDEVVHEKYLPIIKNSMQIHLNQQEVQGLLFKYTHFYGSYDFIGISRNWYKNEIRIVRNDKAIQSYKDAQGFRRNEEKLNVKAIDASIYHYGWVKHPKNQQAKHQSFNKMWHNDDWMEKNIKEVDEFNYSLTNMLAKFEGTHPQTMQKRIQNINWKFSFDPTKNTGSKKAKILHFIENKINYQFGEYKNYKLIK